MKALGRIALLLLLLPTGLFAVQSVSKYEEALEAFKAGRYFEALTLTRRLVEDQPEQPAFRHLHGLTLGALRQYSDAIPELEEAVRLAPDRPDFRQDLGMTYLQADNQAKALNSLQAAIRLDPSNSLARLYLGRLLHNTNRSQDALEQFRAIQEQNERFPTLHFHIARVLRSLGRGEEAIAELRTEIAHFQDNPVPRLELIDLLLKSRDLAEARSQMEQLEILASEQNTGHPARFYWLKAKLLRAEDRLDEAIQAAETCVRVDPAYAEGYYLLGTLLRDRGDVEEASQAFSEFKRLSAEQP